MKNLFNILSLLLSFSLSLWSQTPSDAIMMASKQACVLLEYNYGSFDQYW